MVNYSVNLSGPDVFFVGKFLLTLNDLYEGKYILILSETLEHWQVNHSTFTSPNYASIIIYENILTEFVPSVARDYYFLL